MRVLWPGTLKVHVSVANPRINQANSIYLTNFTVLCDRNSLKDAWLSSAVHFYHRSSRFLAAVGSVLKRSVPVVSVPVASNCAPCSIMMYGDAMSLNEASSPEENVCLLHLEFENV